MVGCSICIFKSVKKDSAALNIFEFAYLFEKLKGFLHSISLSFQQLLEKCIQILGFFEVRNHGTYFNPYFWRQYFSPHKLFDHHKVFKLPFLKLNIPFDVCELA